MRDLAKTLTISVIPPQVIDVVWHDASGLLIKAINVSRRKYTIESIRRDIETGALALWLVLDDATPVAAFTTRIASYPDAKGLCMDWIGGDRMREWLPMAQPLMERYAVDNGCTHLEGYGRKAWGRWLQKYGWEPEYIAYRMEINT